MCPLPVSELPARGVLSRLRWVDPARRFTRSLALGRSSGSFCRQSRTSCPSSYVQSSGTLGSRGALSHRGWSQRRTAQVEKAC